MIVCLLSSVSEEGSPKTSVKQKRKVGHPAGKKNKTQQQKTKARPNAGKGRKKADKRKFIHCIHVYVCTCICTFTT